MEVQKQPRLNFEGVDIINLSFKSEKPFDGDGDINLDVKPMLYYPDETNTKIFMILIEVKLKSEGFFDLNLLALGNFMLSDDTDENLGKALTNANAPAIMFPYVRSFISTLTANLGNTTTLMVIPTQAFKGTLDIVNQEAFIEQPKVRKK